MGVSYFIHFCRKLKKKTSYTKNCNFWELIFERCIELKVKCMHGQKLDMKICHFSEKKVLNSDLRKK